jgi:phosphoribosylanthranilate isomerase
LEALTAVARATPTPVIASGGIASPDHVRAVARIGGVEAAIIGRALYQGTLTLREAIDAAEGVR